MAEIKLSPLAYLQMYKHAKMLANEERFIYGLLSGYIDEGKVFVVSYIPLSHTYNIPIDFEIRHEIFKKIEEFNRENYDPEYLSDQIVGWARSCPTGKVVPTPIDKKNQLYLQSAYCDKGICILIPPSADQYEMSVQTLKGELPELTQDSEFIDVDWNFGEIEDIDDLFGFVLDLLKRRNNKDKIIEELLEPPVKDAKSQKTGVTNAV